MTYEEFVKWSTDDGVVRFAGTDAEYVLVKRRGDDNGAIATREQYENFEVSFAHAFAAGPIKRYGVEISGINQLIAVREIAA